MRDRLRDHFLSAGVTSAPDVASVTFLGVERVEVLRFGPDAVGLYHYVSPACVMSLRGGAPAPGLARSLAVVAAAPEVEGLELNPGALIDLSGPLWTGAPFTAVLLDDSDIPDLLSAVPVTGNEAAWVRLKGAAAMRQAWADDGVDVLDPLRRAARPG